MILLQIGKLRDTAKCPTTPPAAVLAIKTEILVGKMPYVVSLTRTKKATGEALRRFCFMYLLQNGATKELSQIYNEIKSHSLFGKISVLILVVYDPDALSSLKILSKILRNDGILFRIKPITDLDQLRHSNEKYIEKFR
ncbi:hypothetical protein DSO57_1008961 [Entomophthora muscae]|uniref:Uncharacterized protein n=1 Tax=Entomophthora muscae TaxID=34485 RepID=A0ACC2SVQ1_9FUNG|nr:hypothetical protein DSO57_1008961 [Entomophthora muscae]